jgi:hypothetical protein
MRRLWRVPMDSQVGVYVSMCRSNACLNWKERCDKPTGGEPGDQPWSYIVCMTAVSLSAVHKAIWSTCSRFAGYVAVYMSTWSSGGVLGTRVLPRILCEGVDYNVERWD